MSGNTKIRLSLSLEDNASSSFKSAMAKIKAEKTAAAARDKQINADRARLGMRSERDIQAEILRTQRAYNNLARSGRSSQNDLQRASVRTRERIRDLNTELGRTARLTAGQRFSGFGSGLRNGAMGVAAGAAVIAPQIKKVVNYDESLREATTTAYSGQGAEALDKGYDALNDTIKKVVIDIGATREKMLEGLNTLFVRGTDAQSGIDLLPDIMKVSQASYSEPSDIAATTQSLIANGFLDTFKNLNMLVKAGQVGQFEVKDMAAALPSILSKSKGAGYTTQHLPEILASLELLAMTTGNAAEAVTQFDRVNSVLSSPLLSKRMEKVDNPDRPGEGIDWPKTLADGVKAGLTPLEVLMKTVDKIIKADPEARKYAKNLSSADPAKRTEAENAALQVMDRGVMGEILREFMAAAAVLGHIQQGDYYKNTRDKIRNESEGAVEEGYEFRKKGPSAKLQQGKNALELAQYDALIGFSDQLGNTTQYLAEYAAKYPELTKHIVQASTALVTLAAAAGAIALGKNLLGNRGTPPIPVPAGGSVGPNAGAAAAGAGASRAGALVRSVPPVAAGAAILAGSYYLADTAMNAITGYDKETDIAQGDAGYAALVESQGIDVVEQNYNKNKHISAPPFRAEKGKNLYENKTDPRSVMKVERLRLEREQKKLDTPETKLPILKLATALAEHAARLQSLHQNSYKTDPNNPQSSLRLSSVSGVSGVITDGYAQGYPRGTQFDVGAFQELLKAVQGVQIPVQTDITVNLTGEIDGNVLFRAQEKTTVNQLNRGG